MGTFGLEGKRLAGKTLEHEPGQPVALEELVFGLAAQGEHVALHARAGRLFEIGSEKRSRSETRRDRGRSYDLAHSAREGQADRGRTTSPVSAWSTRLNVPSARRVVSDHWSFLQPQAYVPAISASVQSAGFLAGLLSSAGLRSLTVPAVRVPHPAPLRGEFGRTRSRRALRVLPWVDFWQVGDHRGGARCRGRRIPVGGGKGQAQRSPYHR